MLKPKLIFCYSYMKYPNRFYYCRMLLKKINYCVFCQQQMIKVLSLLLFLTTITINYSNKNQQCECLNGGKCTDSFLYTVCECPPLQIGKYCQTKATNINNNAENNIGYVDLTLNFKHFVFSPQEGNYFKFHFNVCTISNPHDLETLIYLSADQEDGSASYQPPIISAAKIKGKIGTCITFSSPFIQIKKEFPKPFRKIIIGVRALQKSIQSYFYRTVTGKFLHEIPSQLLDNQPFVSPGHLQRLYVTFQYEHYKETFMQTLVRKLINILIVLAIVIALLLFSRIALFSYGIDIKLTFICIYRAIKKFSKRFSPFNQEIRNYHNYLKHKAKTLDEQESKLMGKQQCAICIQQFSMEDLIEQTACRHIYHQSCLQKWQQLNQICPLCRQELVKVQGKWIFQQVKS